MEFGLTGNGIAPTADMVKKVLVDEVNNGNLNIRVNASSIVVNGQFNTSPTDISDMSRSTFDHNHSCPSSFCVTSLYHALDIRWHNVTLFRATHNKSDRDRVEPK